MTSVESIHDIKQDDVHHDGPLSVLFHRPTPWESQVNCSTKIFAKYFQRNGFEVSYLENPMDVGHLIKPKGYVKVWKKAPRWEDGIWVMNSFSVIPFRDYFPFNNSTAADLSYYSCIPSISSLLSRGRRRSPDIIWSAKPGSSALKKMFPSATFAFQVVDYYPAFRGEYIKSIEKRDYELADHIFLIGQSMKEYLVDDLGICDEKITVLGQGVDLSLYEKTYDPPTDIADLPHPRAIWVGVLQKGDAELFEIAADSLAGLGGSMILIGPSSAWAQQLQEKKRNVRVLGSKVANEVPQYITNADIGLMLYERRRSEVYQGQNPLKLYEYAAAGLPILSTPHNEFQFLKPPVIDVLAPADILPGIHRAVSQRNELGALAREFVSEYSWQKRFETANRILQTIRHNGRIVQTPV